MIAKYRRLNPYMKQYPHQQYLITNPNFFSEINTFETAYWFGFLNADGSVSKKYNRITLILSTKDRDRLIYFSEAVGFDKKRIKDYIRIRNYNGKLKSYNLSRIRFGCKLMVDDLLDNGFTSSKSKNKIIPNFVQRAIKKAKEKAEKLKKLDWKDNYYGKLALSWLLGFYDGDGTYYGGNSGGIYSSSKLFLVKIKQLFKIKNKISKVFKNRVGFDDIQKNKGTWRLTLGVDLFKTMLNAYEDSLIRKRY